MNIALIFTCFIFGYASAQTVVWSDEFDGPAGQLPDASKWSYDLGGGGWGNQEHQYYTGSASNAALDGNGNLVITARKENPNNFQCWYGNCEYTSARLLTLGKFSHLYGTIEARIKLPIGRGFWPAFWMLGENFGSVGWPECGEIDIMENVGSDPLYVRASLHGTGYSGDGRLVDAFLSPNGQPLANDFHVYQVVWSQNSITFSVDGENYGTRTPSDTQGNRWAFDHPFFIILNLAVGGSAPGNPDDTSVFPQTMVIDYVRVYSASDTPTTTPITTPTTTPTTTPITTPTPITKKIKSALGGLCLNVPWGSSANGTPVQVAYCNGNTAQDWTINDNDHTIRALSKCLEVADESTQNGANVQINECNGSGGQQWIVSTASDIVSVNANKCLDIRMPAQDGAHTQIWDCAGSSNQKWNLD